MNRMPQVKDTSHGFYRRLLLVPFNRKFEGPDADKDLLSTVMRELDGIFLWSLEGLARPYGNDGFTDPQISKNMMAEYKRANNTVVAFIEDCCIIDPNASIKKEDLYKKFNEYCNGYGYAASTENTFFKELYAACPIVNSVRLGSKLSREQYVKGIKLASNAQYSCQGCQGR